MEGDVMASVKNQRSWREFYSDHRFGFLLVMLIGLLIGTPVAIELGLPAWWLDGVMSVLMLSAIFSLCFKPHERTCALVFGIPSVVATVLFNSTTGRISVVILLAGRICEILFLFGSATLIVRALFDAHKFTFDSVFGAICGYLFLGLGWTGLYLLIEGFHPGSFQINQSVILADVSNSMRGLVLSYYSFITLTTVGYGDVLPTTPVTRTLAWMEAIAGQFYLAVVVAGLVNMMASGPSQRMTDQSNDLA